MPAMPWFYDQVVFDPARAEAAIAALGVVRGRIRAVGENRAGSARTARNEWQGRHRTDFDHDLQRSQGGLGEMEVRIGRAIGEIRDAGLRADDERARRDTMCETYEDEQRALAARAEASLTP